MKNVVIGLGSMGRRRIRLMQAMADPPDPKKYLVFYSTMTREEVESCGKFERIVAIGVLLMYLALVGATESWTRPFALMLSSIPAVAGGIFGVWICGHEFTILAQLALMFLLAFPAGLAVRPVAKASVAFCAALALAAVGAEGGARVELPLDGCGERLFTQASMLV